MPSTKKIYVSDDDPLSLAIQPPVDETPEQRAKRQQAEAEAKRVSDEIDEEINRERQAAKKAPKTIKLLLLGQSESGKSTTLKNFQLMNSPKAFREERASWRAVIQLNVVRAILFIMDAMTEAQASAHAHTSSRSSSRTSSSRSRSSSPTHGYTSSASLPPTRAAAPNAALPALTQEHLKLKMRLAPLNQIEASLTRKLNPSAPAGKASGMTNISPDDRPRLQEVSVNGSSAWKGAFSKLLKSDSAARESFDSSRGADLHDPEDQGVVLNALAEDMITLWNDRTIREILHVQKIRVEDLPGFGFMEGLDRITRLDYMPTDQDILRARIKTLGVTEHRFMFKSSSQSKTSHAQAREWRIFDVGGQRSLRAAWAPYFEDVQGIIFLVPISAFNQTLAEDSSVNRMEDSVLLWRSIVSNPLLKMANMILFLNKTDLLKAKLAQGVRFADYIVSYGDRPNDFESTSAYLKRKFQSIHKDSSPEPRPFYCHFTTVTDTTSTSAVLRDVQDILILQNLKDSSLIE